ncbi:MAG: translation elongation factor-like protein [Gammaproteobacteria bacterium]|jgi:putative protease
MEKEIGFVSNYFSKISVAAIEITGDIVAVGDTLHISGNTTDCEFTVDSMQIEHESVTEAGKGDDVGLKVPEKIRKGDKVYKIVED